MPEEAKKIDEVRVLLIEDDHDDVVLTRDMLREHVKTRFHLDHTDDPEEGLRRIADGSYDVVLLDQQLGTYDGISVLEQATHDGVTTPVIMLTGQNDLSTAESALQAGASDYLVKGRTDALSLARSIRYTIERAKAEREKDRALVEMRTAHERLRIALKHAPVAVANQDHDLRYTWAHNRVFGRDASEILGRTDSELIPNEDFASRLASLKRDALESCRGGRMEVVIGENNEACYYDVTVEPLEEEGEVIGVTSAIVETTDSKRLYAIQKALTEELDRRVRDRTRDLEQANDEIRSFTYSVAHDLRAPLRAISSTSGFLCQDYAQLLPDEAKRLLEHQIYSANRLSTLIDDLLETMRLSQVEVSCREFDLSSLAWDVAGRMIDKNSSFSIVIQPGMVADADPKLVRNVLEKLVGNAVKFSPEGGLIEVGFDGQAFYVKDQGVGFDMKYVHKLFLPFERLVGEYEFPGNGIGLAHVKRVVERHGGRAWATGEPGKGACFYFTLR